MRSDFVSKCFFGTPGGVGGGPFQTLAVGTFIQVFLAVGALWGDEASAAAGEDEEDMRGHRKKGRLDGRPGLRAA